MPKGQYPSVLPLGNRMTFSYAPFDTLYGFTDWGNPERALHYLVPPTPSPIHAIGYLISPQLSHMKLRRVFVAFFYGHGEAVLAETHPMAMLHKPLGLRLESGIRFPEGTFNVSHVVIKGDDAPIRIDIVGENAAFQMSIHEGPAPAAPASAVPPTPGEPQLQLLNMLNITLQMPTMPTFSVNTSLPGIV